MSVRPKDWHRRTKSDGCRSTLTSPDGGVAAHVTARCVAAVRDLLDNARARRFAGWMTDVEQVGFRT